ncbi:MAG: Autoinducer 2 sensor kinase/phosphatase LuxQ, partial [Proteobacteria bacterium]|nr:Autoinducer 2 sensor kinase/phosphatase LuxQ [Pseudomonadota bacterium]
ETPWLIIEVEDSGIGIAPGDQARIFDPFVQVGKTSAQKGTGLGLAISREFVQLMGGTLTVESTLGKGSVFRAAFPARLARASEIVAAEPTHGMVIGIEPGQPDYRILIVEDQPENQLLLRKLLETVGFRVKVAENGLEGVELFRSWAPHFIWMDRRMPVMDGLEATRRIRRLEGGREVKIVALTASVFREQREEMMAGGMDDLVSKPYRPDEIFDCMAKHLGVRYMYQGTSETHDAELSPGDMASLPEGLRQALIDAVSALQDDQIAAVVREISAVDGRLGSVLKRHADNLEYTLILRALQAESTL